MKTLCCCLGLMLAGCQSAGPIPTVGERARILLEEVDGSGEAVILPQSGVQIMVNPKPVFTEFDIVNVDIAEVELGRCLVFQLTPAAARDLLRITTANPGRRLVLLLGGVPFGARRIGAPLNHGTLFMFVETPDSALPGLADNLNETSAALRSGAVKR